MVNIVRAALQTIKVFLLFVGCTLLFYYGILWVSQEYESYHRYDEPKGKAIKVFKAETDHVSNQWFDRFILFYREGE